ncbi:MAG: hypothetical protein ACTSUE_07965, partial [Promethearchaeota archaeon]
MTSLLGPSISFVVGIIGLGWLAAVFLFTIVFPFLLTLFNFAWNIVNPVLATVDDIGEGVEEGGEDVVRKTGETVSLGPAAIFYPFFRIGVGSKRANQLSRESGQFIGRGASWVVFTLLRIVLGLLVAVLDLWAMFVRFSPWLLLLFVFVVILMLINNNPANTLNTLTIFGTFGRNAYNWGAGGVNEALYVLDSFTPAVNVITKFVFALFRLFTIRVLPYIGQVLVGGGSANLAGLAGNYKTTFGANPAKPNAPGFEDPWLIVAEQPINDPNRRALFSIPRDKTRQYDENGNRIDEDLTIQDDMAKFKDLPSELQAQQIMMEEDYHELHPVLRMLRHSDDVNAQHASRRRELVEARWFRHGQLLDSLYAVVSAVAFGLDKAGALVIAIMDIVLAIIIPIYTLFAEIAVGVVKVLLCALMSPLCAGLEILDFIIFAGIDIAIALGNLGVTVVNQFGANVDPLTRESIAPNVPNYQCTKDELKSLQIPCLCSGAIVDVLENGLEGFFTGLFSEGERCQEESCYCDTNEESGEYVEFCTQNGQTTRSVTSDNKDVACPRSRRALTALGHLENLRDPILQNHDRRQLRMNNWKLPLHVVPTSYTICFGGVKVRARPPKTSIFHQYHHTLEYLPDESHTCGNKDTQDRHTRRLLQGDDGSGGKGAYSTRDHAGVEDYIYRIINQRKPRVSFTLTSKQQHAREQQIHENMRDGGKHYPPRDELVEHLRTLFGNIPRVIGGMTCDVNQPATNAYERFVDTMCLAQMLVDIGVHKTATYTRSAGDSATAAMETNKQGSFSDSYQHGQRGRLLQSVGSMYLQLEHMQESMAMLHAVYHDEDMTLREKSAYLRNQSSLAKAVGDSAYNGMGLALFSNMVEHVNERLDENTKHREQHQKGLDQVKQFDARPNLYQETLS